jgi:hypothetical protein
MDVLRSPIKSKLRSDEQSRMGRSVWFNLQPDTVRYGNYGHEAYALVGINADLAI